MDYKKIECEVLAIGKLEEPTPTLQTQNLQVKDQAGRKFWLQCFNNTDLLRGIKARDRVSINYTNKGKVSKSGSVFSTNYVNALEKIKQLNKYEQFYAGLNEHQKEVVDKAFGLLTRRRNILDKPHVAYYLNELEKAIGWIPLRDRLMKMPVSEDYDFLTNENMYETI